MTIKGLGQTFAVAGVAKLGGATLNEGFQDWVAFLWTQLVITAYYYEQHFSKLVEILNLIDRKLELRPNMLILAQNALAFQVQQFVIRDPQQWPLLVPELVSVSLAYVYIWINMLLSVYTLKTT